MSRPMPNSLPQTEMGRVKINNEWYIRPVITVAAITIDGSTCIVPVNELMAMIEDGQEYTVQIRKMRVKKFERLEEFQGW